MPAARLPENGVCGSGCCTCRRVAGRTCAVTGMAQTPAVATVADRHADALAAMGWLTGNWFEGIDQVTAALRSWGDRFGARLLAVGHAEFTLLAGRPPGSRPAAQHLAAELRALTADEFTCAWDHEALTNVNDTADSILRSPIWGFWWD